MVCMTRLKITEHYAMRYQHVSDNAMTASTGQLLYIQKQGPTINTMHMKMFMFESICVDGEGLYKSPTSKGRKSLAKIIR